MVRHPRRRPARRLALEPLEDRRLLAADLRLTSVLLVENDDGTTPTTPVLGERVCIRANFQTTDLSAGASYRLEFMMDGVAISQTLTLGAGLTGTRSWNRFQCGWYATPGSHSVEQVTLDADDTVVEPNEGNNTLLPDITFTPSTQTTLPQLLVNPMGGVAYQDWSFVNYYDIDATVGIEDFEGGEFTYDGHAGYDISLSNFSRMDGGVPVYAAADGIVESVQDGNFDRNTERGSRPANFVVINYGGGWSSQYFHFMANTIVVQAGESVRAGQLLGLAGSSGDSNGAHLHFNLRRNGAPVEMNYDPASYFVAPQTYQGDRPTTVKDIRITNVAPTDEEIREGVSEHTVFSTANPKNVYCWFRDSHFQVGDQFQVKWYRPGGALNTSQNVTVNSVHRNGWFWRSLGSATIHAVPGTWRVTIEMDGQELASRTFEVTTGPGTAGIKVQASDGSPIIDNRTTPIDFGSATAGGASLTQTFTIINHGTASLALANLRLPPGFSVVGSFPESVSAGASTTVTIGLDTAKPGVFLGAMQFSTNDPESPVFNFHVSGSVTGSPSSGSPALSLPAAAAVFRAPGAPVVIDGTATLTDSDSASWSGGNVKVEFTALSSPRDVLGLGAEGGLIGISGAGVLHSGVVVGTFSGGANGQPLSIEFNVAASLGAVEAVLRSVTFHTSATDPDSLARYVRFAVTDETGKSSNLPTAVVVQDLKPTTVIVDESGNLVLVDSSFAGKSDYWQATLASSELVFTDLTGNAIDASSLAGSTGNGTSSVKIPLSALAGINQWLLDARQGTDRLMIDVANGNPIPTGGAAIVSGNPTISAVTPNREPTLSLSADSTDLLEDADEQVIDLADISAGLGEAQQLVVSAVSDNTDLIDLVAVDHVHPSALGTVRFKPHTNASGTATIVVTVKDNGGTLSGGIESISRTLTVNMAAVNDRPGFVKGPDLQVTDEDGAQEIPDWATSIVAGPAQEQSQALDFRVTADEPNLFVEPPRIDRSGVLRFTPRPNAYGEATISVRLDDDGGTANSGLDQSDVQNVVITIRKLHPWHNALHGLDVTGPGDVVDGKVVPADALAIINHINAFGAGKIPANATPGPPYLDTVGGPNGSGDDEVVPADVLAIVNFINAFGSNLPGPEGEGRTDLAGSISQRSAVPAELLWLLAVDTTGHGPARRKSGTA